MRHPKKAFAVDADVTNPGHFFACCGILEVASRLWPQAEGWFEGASFHVSAEGDEVSLDGLIATLRNSRLCPDGETNNEQFCPLRLELATEGGSVIRLDWWIEEAQGQAFPSTWAGQQKVTTISKAMHRDAVEVEATRDWLNAAKVVYSPSDPKKPVEPFYFDARRYADALDTGFSIDAIGGEVAAYPAVEFLALIGLQRFRPRPVGGERLTYEYFIWHSPLAVSVAAGVASGVVPFPGSVGFRFRLLRRDDQGRYKAFGFATPIGGRR